MSITFSLSRYDATKGYFACVCQVDHGVCTVIEHLLDEDIQAYSMPGHCVECSITGRDECAICGASVNMSNTNAAAVIERLGLEFDYCGQITSEDLMGRALTGNVGRDDSGAAPTVDAAEGRATLIESGLPAGYFEGRLGQLANLAALAIEHDAVITWG